MQTVIFNTNSTEPYLDYVVNKLKKGSVGIFPTDTVYGIGCDARNLRAVRKLYDLKFRSLNKPINILVSNIDMINDFVKNINPIEQKLIDNFWPGALTIIFDKSNLASNLLTADLPTIGIRMPDNKLCLDLINRFGNPLATSSANISNKETNNSIKKILLDFNNKVDFIINDGDLPRNSMPSTIVRVENNKIKILREGEISLLDINKCLGGNNNAK